VRSAEYYGIAASVCFLDSSRTSWDIAKGKRVQGWVA
jgi:hypothetical protein